MANENILFKYPHLTIDSGYFCMFDHTLNIFIKKLSDGEVAFAYPIVGTSVTAVKSLEFDGIYFWSLHDGTVVGSDVIINKWKIENNFCVLKDTFNFIGDSSDIYDCESFTIDSYSTDFSSTVTAGESYVSTSSYINIIDQGTVLYLGPNNNGEAEEVTVTGTISANTVGLNFYTKYTYESGDPINFSKYIWMFNNYSGLVDDGALYKFKTSNGSFVEKIYDNEYHSVGACTFSRITNIARLGNFDALLYVKGTNLKFIDVEDLSVYCVLGMDNIRANGSTTIPVYDLVVYNESIYRLQYRSMYYESDYTWSTYNYQLSPIREFIDSITVGASPTILPSNGINVAEVIATVYDQYSQPIIYKIVNFSDDNAEGYLLSTQVFTYLDGKATTTYRAGTIPDTVIITAEATQND